MAITDEQVKKASKAYRDFPAGDDGVKNFSDCMRAALEAAIEKAAAWRPIEEAPKDGTPFHGLVGEDLLKMFWHDGFGEFVSSFRRMQLHNGYRFADGKDYEDHSPVIHSPKYFRPLPEPPK